MSFTLFKTGQLRITPGALSACSQERILECLACHCRGDWGTLGDADGAANDAATRSGQVIVSVHHIIPGPAKEPPGG